jgi:acyl-coenzyme A thioesterase 7
MEIEVLVDADPVVDNSQKRYRAASAFFTYVSLSQEGKPMPVPQLVVSAYPRDSDLSQGHSPNLQPQAVGRLDEGVPCKLQGALWALPPGL